MCRPNMSIEIVHVDERFYPDQNYISDEEYIDICSFVSAKNCYNDVNLRIIERGNCFGMNENDNIHISNENLPPKGDEEYPYDEIRTANNYENKNSGQVMTREINDIEKRDECNNQRNDEYEYNTMLLTENRGKLVSFGSVTVRYFPVTLGEHPGCNGAPVRLGKKCTLEITFPFVEDHETSKGNIYKRNVKELRLSSSERKKILRKVAKCSKEEIRQRIQEMKVIKAQRDESLRLYRRHSIQHMLYSPARKIKKITGVLQNLNMNNKITPCKKGKNEISQHCWI